MSNEQKKFQKKKARERKVKTKLLAKRENKRRQMKGLREEAKELEAVDTIVRRRIELEQWAKAAEDKIPEDLRTQIQKNIDILKALEQEYVQELKQKSEMQEKLQSQGLYTLPEMLGALQENTAEQQKAAHGSADLTSTASLTE